MKERTVGYLIVICVAFIIVALNVIFTLINDKSTVANFAGIAACIVLAICSIELLLLFIKSLKMKKLFNVILLLTAVVFSGAMSSCAYERIDAGCEGIKVNLYGDEKGVGEVSMCTGAVWYNPITTAIFEYPTYVQTVDYPAFTINAKDGSEFVIDPTISLKIVDGQSPIVFKKYRKGLNDVINGTLYNYVKDAFRIELNSYTTSEIVGNRAAVEKAIETHLSQTLTKENFQLEQLTSGLKYPQSIVDAVNAKNKAIEEAKKAENELAVVEAEAKKKIVAAQAEAEANRLRQQALTPAILQKMWIERWDGVLPKYTGNGNSAIISLQDLK